MEESDDALLLLLSATDEEEEDMDEEEEEDDEDARPSLVQRAKLGSRDNASRKRAPSLAFIPSTRGRPFPSLSGPDRESAKTTMQHAISAPAATHDRFSCCQCCFRRATAATSKAAGASRVLSGLIGVQRNPLMMTRFGKRNTVYFVFSTVWIKTPLVRLLALVLRCLDHTSV